ncbi:hypothetical protein BG015_004477 [Linnemannia schmuckeri]|uniref:Fe2OG dioxygenase domain-containing protein n=1 Tax=Linnemannia schmuckeri TaxID=64567 RepID=A0A9P5RDF4_9FUNG|nr:hypothetical protein BG015_004477 [Linnemannia schmuckeri]
MSEIHAPAGIVIPTFVEIPFNSTSSSSSTSTTTSASKIITPASSSSSTIATPTSALAAATLSSKASSTTITTATASAIPTTNATAPTNPTAAVATTTTDKVATKANEKVKVLSLQDFDNPATRPRFLADMRESLIDLGTFYIKDHGITTEMTAGAMKSVQDYFALPLEEKKKMLICNSRHFRGYKLIGEEFTNNQVDHREQLQFGPEQSALPSFVPTQSPDYQGLQGPNQWPASTLELLPAFQPHIIEFMHQLETLSHRLMEAVALSLGQSAHYFRDLFGDTPYYRLKAAKYPSVKNTKAATIGCGAHKDTGFLTVLLQDMVGGLQGQIPATGEWMDTRPVPETFIVTMGEAMERMTGGLYQATVHRVLNNMSGQDRYSIPFFFDPSLDTRVPHQIENLDRSARLDFSNAQTRKELPKADGEKFCGLGITTQGNLSFPDASASSSRHATACVDDEEEGWSSGAHVFETVHRCHPEVYARWYTHEE